MTVPIQMDDYLAGSSAINPTAFLFCISSPFLIEVLIRPSAREICYYWKWHVGTQDDMQVHPLTHIITVSDYPTRSIETKHPHIKDRTTVAPNPTVCS